MSRIYTHRGFTDFLLVRHKTTQEIANKYLILKGVWVGREGVWVGRVYNLPESTKFTVGFSSFNNFSSKEHQQTKDNENTFPARPLPKTVPHASEYKVAIVLKMS